MKSELTLPKLDNVISAFIKTQGEGLFFGTKFTVGIKYYGFIYREIYCGDRQEFHELEQFLLSTGYVRKDEPHKPFDAVFEIVD